jgi:D-arabinose 1-dehydrogenase-like Zn-dependent alcohol dehydrogenase
MRAARYYGPGDSLRLEEVPIPQPGPGEALVRVRAAGVCHTELHFLSGVLNLGVAPLTLGHEMAGEVAKVGPGVTSVRPGERVIVYYYLGCGACHWCRTGQENLCDALVAEYGFVSDGGLAEYVRVPARNLVKLPANLSFEEAATLGCSATTAIHAAGLARLAPGDVALVYGFGGVGAALVQYCDLAGARVIAVGRSPAKLQLARDLGAEAAIDAGREDVPARVRELTGGQGADVVFELVGTAESMPKAVASLRKRGRLVFIGYSQDLLTVSPIQFVVLEAQVLGSVGNTLDELSRAVDLAAAGGIRATIDRVVPLEDVNRVLDDLRQGKVVGRAVVRP